MSDTSRNRPDRHTDRPPEVTDPLLWDLALDVADTHQPDDGGGCRSLLCAGQAWPCATWNTAQRALRAAQRPVGATGAPPVVGAGRTGDHDQLGGGSPGLAAGRRLRPAAPGRKSRAA
ncbi:hypothetical protein ACTMSW_29925 [Micromonospora sp. BQ11]|uniref:hypothetical protein n=1 Tax=Micromonospora sp. BQ11 TaxID=3452212 RepID=UPI003F8CC4D3